MKTAYLTIDDAPSPDFSKKVRYLADRNLPALFFCVGDFLRLRPDEVCAAIEKGFVVGNHSLTHPHFSDLALEDCLSEVLETDRLIDDLYALVGVARPGKYFRFPYFDSGGDLSGADYEAKWSRPPETWSTYPRLEKRREIQTFLRRLGYGQPAFHGINRKFFADPTLLEEADVRATFDQAEYHLGQAEAPWGLSTPDAILARIDEDVPYQGRSLNCLDTADIVVVHDHEATTELFFPIIDRYLEKGIHFLAIEPS